MLLIMAWLAINRTILFSFIFCSCPLVVLAQSNSASPTPSPSPESKTETRDPIERSDEFKPKLTFSVYFTNGERLYNLKLLHQSGPLTSWIAVFDHPTGPQVIRC